MRTSTEQRSEIDGALKNFDQLPDSGLVRIQTLCGLLDCSSATIWRGVRRGTFPAPIRPTPKITGWNVGDIRALLSGESSHAPHEGSKRARAALAAKRAAAAGCAP
jgi:predicted DNA-binding transcriptional regulator AlpA